MFWLDKFIWWLIQRRVRFTRPTHQDNRRVLHAMTFGPMEVVHIRYRRRAVLGNHWHPYTERWTLVAGEAVATVLTHDAVRGDVLKVWPMRAGDKLIIATGDPHAIAAEAGAVLLIVKPAAPYEAEPYHLV